jgi:hypothetical protein
MIGICAIAVAYSVALAQQQPAITLGKYTLSF